MSARLANSHHHSSEVHNTWVDLSLQWLHTEKMKVVLDMRPGTGYQDSNSRYHFPARYLRGISAAIGDWAVLYEPSRGNGRRSYIAVAKIASVASDPTKPGHHFANLTDFLPFDAPVPLKGPSGYREALLRRVRLPKDIGRTLQGRSVREISDEDFESIVRDGLQRSIEESTESASYTAVQTEYLDIAGANGREPARRAVERMLVSRAVRDAAFRNAVMDAYNSTCAVTGLRIVSRSGNFEAQAAHIVPVSEGGADVVQNGIALTSTAHWLFDQYLLAIGGEGELIVSDQALPMLPASLFEPGRRVLLPKDRKSRPHPALVARHRARFLALSADGRRRFPKTIDSAKVP